MLNKKIMTNLPYTVYPKEMDIDYRIVVDNYPINLDSGQPLFSRIQFPNTKIMLIRTSSVTEKVTIHLLGDTDLYSSFVNFEVDLSQHLLRIEKKEGYIEASIEECC